jgi:ornithine cyclodeaminase/alanine dehydrogenase
VVVVSNARNGRLLALLDSIELTIIRTGAATAIATKYLSKANSRIATICGCGNQGRISLKALKVVRDIQKVFAWDIDEDVALKFSNELSAELNVDIEVIHSLRQGLDMSDICITCTPSKKYFLNKQDVRAGTFIAAVGSDNEDKQELDPCLLSDNKVVVDSLEQASKIGELHHALQKDMVGKEQVCELGEIIVGMKPGRTSADEIIIFDSTGTALQDVAAAAIVYEKAAERGMGEKFVFAS